MSLPDHLIKVTVVGEEKIGKSNLVKALCHDNKYQFLSNHTATIGVDFGDRIIDESGKKLKLQVWDTAGNERYRRLISSYYRGTDIFLLCFDPTNRKFLNQLAYFVKEINGSEAENAQFILVGTKGDELHKARESDQTSIISKQEITDFLSQNGLTDSPVMLTSAKNHNNQKTTNPSGIKELKNKIGELAASRINLHAQSEWGYSESYVPKNHSRSSHFFTPTKTKAALTVGVGVVAGAAAVTIATLACVGVLTLNPIVFGLAVGLLAALSIGALVYGGACAYQNHQNEKYSLQPL